MNTPNANTMTKVEKVVRKLYEYTKGLEYDFDSEYCPVQELCPHLTINENRMRVVSVWITKQFMKEGIYLGLHLFDKENMKHYKKYFTMGELADLSEDEVMYILHEMYYETDMSPEIGDWEDDFLPLCE